MPGGAGAPSTRPSHTSVRESSTGPSSATTRGSPSSVRQTRPRLVSRRETEPTSICTGTASGPTIGPGVIRLTRGRGARVSTSVVRGTITERPSRRSVTRTR